MNHIKLFCALFLSIGLLILGWKFTPIASSQSETNKKLGSNKENNGHYEQTYDIRKDSSGLSKHKKEFDLVSKRLQSSTSQLMASGHTKLRKDFQGKVTVTPNEFGLSPDIVSINQGCSSCNLARSFTEDHSAAFIVEQFLINYSESYGLTDEQIKQLVKKADYENPNGLKFVKYKQQINGLDVFQAELNAVLTKNNELVRTTGNLVPGLDYNLLSTQPNLSPEQSIRVAVGSLEVPIDLSNLHIESQATDESFKTSFATSDGTGVTVNLVYFPFGPGDTELSYSVVIMGEHQAYYMVVSATDGQLFFRKNIMAHQTEPATYSVYNDDSPAPLSPSNATPGSGIQGTPISRTLFNIVSELPAFDNLGWIPDGSNTTTGNNVDAGLDIDRTNGIDPNGRAVGSPHRVFNFSYNPGGTPGEEAPTSNDYRMGVVTNMFFWSNRYHDRLYELGFTEAAGNFQNNNFNRGGVGNDAVMAEAQDYSGTNNANFSTPPDGIKPRMQMFIFTGPEPDRDSALDQEIVIHELTHGLSNRLHGNASGLNGAQSDGMGEGWSDFYARALLSTANEDINGIYPAGAYSTRNSGALGSNNYYYGIRRFPYAIKSAVGPNGKPHNPLTFADIDPAQFNISDGAYPPNPNNANSAPNAVHRIGEVWCVTLLEVRARLIQRLGFEAGNKRALQLVTDGMKLNPMNPTLLQARDSILAADCAAFNGEDEQDIWAGFATRGMGFSARTSSGTTTVTEAFDMPNLSLGTVTFKETTGNNNNVAEPGETLELSIPLANPFCKTNALNTKATVGESASVDYGTIAAGASLTKTFSYTVPVNTACGSQVSVPVVITSSLGTVTKNYLINVGQRINKYNQNFDSVSLPYLPPGWTTQQLGNAPTWVSSISNPKTAPNNVFAPNVNVSGISELISPKFYIDSSLSRLSFSNSYNVESSFDGMVLEISIDSGPYQDILTAGGSFLSGGYNGTLSTLNPLGQKLAWTGLSGGTTSAPAYITTVVNLPVSASGKFIQLKWRLSNDSIVSAPGLAGVRIDDVVIQSGGNCSPLTGISPSVQITSPANDVTLAVNQSINIEANASDMDGSIAKVEFFQNGIKIGEDTSAPYVVTWSSVPKGSYVVTAKATDDAGNFTTSTGVFVKVSSPCNYSLNQSTTTVGPIYRPINLVNVISDSECAWTVSSNVSWITITSGVLGYGNAPVRYTVFANNSATSRTGTVTIAGHTYTVTQAGVTGLQYYPLSKPVRLLDSRAGEPACFNPSTALVGSSVYTQLARTTCSGETIPSNAVAITGNATVVNTIAGAGSGYVTIYPSGVTRPTVSNLNYASGQVVANAFTVNLGTDGSFNIYPSATTDMIIDVTGYYAPPSTVGFSYIPLPTPIRVLDTRPGEPACLNRGASMIGKTELMLNLRTVCSPSFLPSNAVAVVGNATVVNDTPDATDGYATLYPFGIERPTVSNINYTPGSVVPNMFTSKLGANGAINIYVNSTTNFVLDIIGYYVPHSLVSTSYYLHPLSSPVRLLDTRPGEPACSNPGRPLTGNAVYVQVGRNTTCNGETIPVNAMALIGNATVVNALPEAKGGYAAIYPSNTPGTVPTISTLNYAPNQIVPNSFIVGVGSDNSFSIYPSSTTDFLVDIMGYYSAD
jgi:hypothetical protein